jgi:hypothetical protein
MICLFLFSMFLMSTTSADKIYAEGLFYNTQGLIPISHVKGIKNIFKLCRYHGCCFKSNLAAFIFNNYVPWFFRYRYSSNCFLFSSLVCRVFIYVYSFMCNCNASLLSHDQSCTFDQHRTAGWRTAVKICH